MPASSQFALLTAADPAWLIASGDIDMATAPALAQALQTGRYEGVDLTAVTFLDVSGLRVLLTAARVARQAGRPFAVANPSPMVRRVLDITAIDQTLEVAGDQSSAITSR
jgi:anti-anti-sigma factor